MKIFVSVYSAPARSFYRLSCYIDLEIGDHGHIRGPGFESVRRSRFTDPNFQLALRDEILRCTRRDKNREEERKKVRRVRVNYRFLNVSLLLERCVDLVI